MINEFIITLLSIALILLIVVLILILAMAVAFLTGEAIELFRAVWKDWKGEQ